MIPRRFSDFCADSVSRARLSFLPRPLWAAGSPSSLLATGDEVNITNSTEQAIDLPFSGAQQISLVGGTAYWIGVHFQTPSSGDYGISRANTADLTKVNNDTYSDGPEATFTIDTSIGGAIDCFGTYTQTGAAIKATGFMTINTKFWGGGE